jgi:hypothetical protein
MCSEEECRDRQFAMEVSEWEATSDTFLKPPKARIIDPCLAVSKYRRSAAGTKQRQPRSLNQLIETWKHLRHIMLHQKIHTNQPTRAWAVVVSFLDDRIRAIQVDLVVSQQVSGALQAQLVRYQLVALYLLAGVSRTIFEPKFAKLALMTALVAYWNDADSERHDDEILCCTTLCHVAATLSDSSWVEGETTLATYRQYACKNRTYTNFRVALKIAAAVHTQQYYIALKLLSETSSLNRLCMAPCLNRLRWLCLGHYNKAFMKRERLSPDEVARLLYLPNGQAAIEFCTNAGFPVEEGLLVFKAAPMRELQSYDINRSIDDWFCLGPTVDYRVDSDNVKIPSQELLQQLVMPDDS